MTALALVVLLASPALANDTVPNILPDPGHSLIDPQSFTHLQIVWQRLLKETARTGGNEISSQFSHDLAGPLAMASENMALSEICQGKASSEQVRHALYSLAMEAFSSLGPLPEARLRFELALRDALAAALPDDLQAECPFSSRYRRSEAIKVFTFRLTRAELHRIIGERKDRAAIVERLEAAFPERTASLSHEALLAVVPRLIVASRIDWEPPDEVSAAFFEAVLPQSEEVYE